MYDKHLDTFIQTADCGSFLKASEKMFISANAITKQINLLEERLKVKLFHRSPQGLELTDAGQLIYTEAKKLIRQSNAVLRKAQELEAPREYVVHIGVSLMNPVNLLLEQWDRAAQTHPNIKLEIVPFEDTVPAFNEVLDHLGERIDVISCPYETSYWGDRYQSFHLRDLPLCITCSKTHPLAGRERLTFQDLHGETLWMADRGLTTHQDQVRDDLEQNHPEITIKSAPYLDTDSFNRLASSRELMLSAECWGGVHPLLATIPLDCPYTIPYGLIYAKDPPKEVMQFIMAVGQVNEIE